MTTGQYLDFSTATQDSHPAQYDGANKRWAVPTGGAGLWVVAASVHGTVSGAVSVTRGGIAVNGTKVADLCVWPLGGTHVGDSAACVIPLADGATVSVSLAVVGGTSAAMALTQFSAVRLPMDSFAP